MRWVIHPVLAALSNLLQWFGSPDPAAEVRLLFIHHYKAQCQAVSDKPALLALGELGRQSLPAGAGLGAAPHLTGVTQELTGVITAVTAMTEPVTPASSPKHSSSFQLPLAPQQNHIKVFWMLILSFIVASTFSSEMLHSWVVYSSFFSSGFIFFF